MIARTDIKDEELDRDLFDFYLLNCPYARSDKSGSSTKNGIDLYDRGWKFSSLAVLMQWVESELSTRDADKGLKFYVSQSLNDTIESTGLCNGSDGLFVGAALLINNKMKVDEEGKCEIKLIENYATCFFRHIRNSLARGNFSFVGPGCLLLLDSNGKPGAENKTYTAAIRVDASSLCALKDVVLNGYSDFMAKGLASDDSPAYFVSVQDKVTVKMK